MTKTLELKEQLPYWHKTYFFSVEQSLTGGAVSHISSLHTHSQASSKHELSFLPDNIISSAKVGFIFKICAGLLKIM